MEEAIRERAQELPENGYTPTSLYEILAGKVQSIEQDNLKTTLIHEIEKTHTHIHSVEDKLTAHIDAVENKLTAQIHSVEDKLTAQIHAVENRLDARIDLVQEQIKSTNTRIDSLETSVNTRIDSLEASTNTRIDSLEASTNMRMDDMKTIIDKMDKRISVMFAISGIVFTGIFTILGVILSKLG